jgi:hypothetical protein
MPCHSALELAMKALAFRSLVAVNAMNASRAPDAQRLVGETLRAADFGAHIAGDAVELACAGGLVLQ